MGAIRGGAVLLSLWLQIWLVAHFGAVSYGEYVFFLTFCSLVIIIAKGGLDTVALKEVAIASNRGDTRGVYLIRFRYLQRGVVLAVATCVAPWLAYSLVSSWRIGLPVFDWGLICGASIGAVVFQILVALARGVDRPAVADAFDAIFRTALMAGVAMAMAIHGQTGARAIVIAYASSFYLASLLLYRLTWVTTTGFASGKVESDRQNYNAKAHFGFMLAGLLGYVFFQMDTLILGGNIDPIELGAYNMACNLVRAVIFLPMILVVLVQPRIAVAFEKADMRQVTRIALWAIGASLVVAVLCSLLLWLFGEFILRCINPGFVTAAPALTILAAAHVVNSMLIILGGIVAMTSKYLDVVRAQMAGGAVALVCYVVLIPSHGTIGAALSMFAGLLVVLGCYVITYRKYIFNIYDLLLS